MIYAQREMFDETRFLAAEADRWALEGHPAERLSVVGARLVDARALLAHADFGPLLRQGSAAVGAYLEACAAKETADRGALRSSVQRGFVAPAEAAMNDRRSEKALRTAAAGALMSDDVAFALESGGDEPHRNALLRTAMRGTQHSPRVTLSGHARTVLCQAISPDGARVLIGSSDRRRESGTCGAISPGAMT